MRTEVVLRITLTSGTTVGMKLLSERDENYVTLTSGTIFSVVRRNEATL